MKLVALMVAILQVSQVESATRMISAGNRHACAVLYDSTIKCWGLGFNGQLGYGDQESRGDETGELGNQLPTVDLGTGRTALQVSCGTAHTCAILDNSSVKCWGSGFVGQLGYGVQEIRGDGAGEMGNNLPVVDLGAGLTATQISAGGTHTCAVLSDASIKCWGQGRFGRLGYGDEENRGDGSGEMGNALPAVDLGTGRTATQVACGSAHSCALLDDGTIKCWGAGFNGPLGYGDIDSRGDGPNEMGNNLLPVDLGPGRTAVYVSTQALSSSTCAILDDGNLKCWGRGFEGQLGYGDKISRGDNPGEMGSDLPTVDLGSGRTAVQVDAGSFHTCAVLDDATVKCWGRNDFASLGYGDTEARGTDPGQMGDELLPVDLGTGRTVTQVSVGGIFTCALLDDATVKCWGSGNSGELGRGAISRIGGAPGEMGNNLTAIDVGLTFAPTPMPSSSPTASPSQSPTGSPSQSPTGTPSRSPTLSPSSSPTGSPSKSPTTLAPTASPVSSGVSLMKEQTLMLRLGFLIILAVLVLF